jgi:hypothetical protein
MEICGDDGGTYPKFPIGQRQYSDAHAVRITHGFIEAVIDGARSTATSVKMGGIAEVTGAAMMDDDNGKR